MIKNDVATEANFCFAFVTVLRRRLIRHFEVDSR